MLRFTTTTRIILATTLITGMSVSSGNDSGMRTINSHVMIETEDAPTRIDPVKLAKVKAAFLINFLKFTKWPNDAFDNAQSPNRVCLIGKSPVGRYFELALKTSKVHGRSVILERSEIPRRRQFATTQEFNAAMTELRSRLEQCNMIYISQINTENAGDLLRNLNLRKTLVISDNPSVLSAGGHLSFMVSNGHVAFSASVTNIQKTELKVSSKLLRLAKITK